MKSTDAPEQPHSGNSLRCAQCNLEFHNGRALGAHCVKVHLLHQRSVGRVGHRSRADELGPLPRREHKLKCSYCTRRFLTLIDRDLHLRAAHPNRLVHRRAEIDARIETCLSEFRPSSDLLLSSSAPAEATAPAPDQPEFSTSIALVADNEELKPSKHTCGQCEQSFRSLHGLHIHMTKAHAPNPRPRVPHTLEAVAAAVAVAPMTRPIQPSSALLDVVEADNDLKPASSSPEPAVTNARASSSSHSRKPQKTMRIVAPLECFLCDTCLHECSTREELLTHIQETHFTLIDFLSP